jgi:hypothetical protein
MTSGKGRIAVNDRDVQNRSILKRIGTVMSILVILSLLYDGLSKVTQSDAEVVAMRQIGFTPDTLPVMGWLLLLCVALYAVPRTAIVGAVLLTAYLGGAFCATFRVHTPVPVLLAPVVFAVPVWLSLYLRSPAFRRLVSPGGDRSKSPRGS